MIVKSVLFVLLATIISLTTACNLAITPPPTTPAPTVTIHPHGVIFTAEQTEENLDVIFPRPEGTWTPTAADIAKLEADLPAFLRSAENPWLRTDPPIWEREPQYMRQYLGIVENGEEIIYANFFCTVDELDWQNEYVFVMDGGDCFFQFKYNPQSSGFFDLSVNGES